LAAILFVLATVAISAVLSATANADPALNGAVVVFGSNFDGQTVVPVLPAGMTYTAVAGGGTRWLALRSAPAPAPALAVAGIDSTAAVAVGVIILLLGAALLITSARRQRT